MSKPQLQAGLSTLLPICVAYTKAGNICGRPATVLDKHRGGMVCGVHSPAINRPYEVTRSFLAKAEELLLQAAEQARKESEIRGRNVSTDTTVKITSLALAARRIRFEMEGGE